MLKYILIIFICLAFISGCSDPNKTDGACGDGSFYLSLTKYVESGNISINFETKYPYDTSYIYYRLNNNKAQFYIAKSQLNVCSEKHAEVQFQVYFDSIQHTLPIKVTGEIFWSLFGDDYTLINDTPFPYQIVTTTFYQIGLKQAFPNKPADFDVILTVEFQDLGDTDKNIDYFIKHIRQISFTIRGDNHFPI